MRFDHHLFSAAIQSRMLLQHLSVREVAQATGVSASTISRVMRGKVPDMESFAALVDWLEVDTNQFFESPLYGGNSLIDVWTGLYLALEQLEVPKELIDAIITIIRLITAKKGSVL